MRLDKYLKVSRIIKRRTVSNDACDAGRVQVNSKQQKAGYQVKEGDIIEITFGEKTHKFKILLTDDVVARKTGAPMFEEVR
ncbi:MAG: RNA-binding S4 domain-containing protein [Clostridiales bacterium]|nr:RNA-binding S4 domain-containing protein [Clostridiales bacterium]